MKKSIFISLFLWVIVQFAEAKTVPLEIYSSNRFWESDKTKTGSFKLRNATIIKQSYLFTIYKDHITFKNRGLIIYKINKIESKWSDATHYLVSDSKGQSFMIIKNDELLDNQHLYSITIMKTTQDGKWLSLTRFDLKKIK